MKVFPAVFVASNRELTTAELVEAVGPVIKASSTTSKYHGWASYHSGPAYILFPKEAVPYGKASGLIPEDAKKIEDA